MRKAFVVLLEVTPLAFLVAVGVPNFREALDRAHQKRTLADMRTIATAWEARAEDLKTYRAGGRPVVSWVELQHALAPSYIRRLPALDAWGNPFLFRTGDPDEKGEPQTYVIVSVGKDRKPDRTPYTQRYISDYETDVVYTNGSFLQYPEGT